MTILLLDNAIQPYHWGPVDGLARVLGTPPTGGHEAELWVGTHERGPSVVASGPATGSSLADVIGLGLPFLLKVLAIGAPLSIQAHPSQEQAEAGFAREEAAGIDRQAPERTFRDPSAKPEVLVAIDDTWALCGLRSHEMIEADLAGLSIAGRPDTRQLLTDLWHLEAAEREALVGSAVTEARRRRPAGPEDRWWWVLELAEAYPADTGVVAPLVLELVHLAPGDAVHLPAGNLHAYLRGLGVEIMAASDNVLRGGLTSKHVDVDALLDIVDFDAGVPPAPTARTVGSVTVYDAGEEACSLARVAPGHTIVDVGSPSLLLPMGGGAAVRAGDVELEVAGGQAVFVPAGTAVTVDAAVAVWWATTGDGHRHLLST